MKTCGEKCLRWARPGGLVCLCARGCEGGAGAGGRGVGVVRGGRGGAKCEFFSVVCSGRVLIGF